MTPSEDRRPTISPALIAHVTDGAPDRVRRRLDRNPNAAAEWKWTQTAKQWSIECGNETVTLRSENIDSLDHAACTCLLAPHCFHLLACLSSLALAAAEASVLNDATPGLDTNGNDTESAKAAPSAGAGPSDKQRDIAKEFAHQVGRLLRVGVANCGVVAQSSLLRIVHKARSESLHRLSAIGIRIITGVKQFRSRSVESDPHQLSMDIAMALEAALHIHRDLDVNSFWMGTARRQQLPVNPKRLHGLFAEPVLTRSGYAGAAACFLGEDDRIYSVSDVKPGGIELARAAYLGGIEIGSIIQPAKQFCRGMYVGTEMTASSDGRLGKGKSIRIVENGFSEWSTPAIRIRFDRSFHQQINDIFATAELPPDARNAGWDLAFLRGTVVAALGPTVVFQLEEANGDQVVQLAIENESKHLYFRENLRMLSRAPGLALDVICRVNPSRPTVVYPLAVQASDEPNAELSSAEQEKTCRLVLPESWRGRCCLGFDELQIPHLLGAQTHSEILEITESGSPSLIAAQNDPALAALQRRWIAVGVAGTSSPVRRNLSTLASEAGLLEKGGYDTGGALLTTLASLEKANAERGAEVFLATALYLRTCRNELAKSTVTMTKGE